jgi:hypothetical protein
MTTELRHLIVVHSNHEACSEQDSLAELLADLRATADELGLDLDRAYFQANLLSESRDPRPFYPFI